MEVDSTGRVAVLSYARTPFGRFGGALRDLPLPVLGAIPLREAVARSDVQPADVDEFVLGVNFPGSERSVARQVSLRAGFPEESLSYTVDRACCSSLTAINAAARSIRLGESSIAAAGGADNLSRVPYFLQDLRFGKRLGDVVMEDQLAISCPHTGVPRAIQAADEALAHDVDRTAQDEWALRSQRRYAEARKAGKLVDELVPVADAASGASLDHDEVPRPGTKAEDLASLPTVYGSSTVTAGNAPNLSSGSAIVMLSSLAEADRRSLKPVATIEGWSMVAGPPHNIASIPARAVSKTLNRVGLDLDDIDVFEINEAFAAVPLVTTLVLCKGDVDAAEKLRKRVNVNGGAIAVGHPTGASGARLVMSVISELRARGGGTGLVAICGGIGEAEALLVRVDSE